MCSEDDCTIESGGDDDEIKALDVGTFLARSIRETIRERLGFTLSAGIGCNKTIAKLAASYGKPNGQAVVYPHAVEWLMDQTPISKCRNLGGKLGMKVQALLSSSSFDSCLPPTPILKLLIFHHSPFVFTSWI